MTRIALVPKASCVHERDSRRALDSAAITNGVELQLKAATSAASASSASAFASAAFVHLNANAAGIDSFVAPPPVSQPQRIRFPPEDLDTMQEPHFPPNEVIDGDLAHAIHAIEEAPRASLAELEAQPLECKVSIDFKVSVRQGRVSVARLGGGDPVAVASGNSWHVFPAIAALLDPTWTTEDLFRAYQVTLVKGSRSCLASRGTRTSPWLAAHGVRRRRVRIHAGRGHEATPGAKAWREMGRSSVPGQRAVQEHEALDEQPCRSPPVPLAEVRGGHGMRRLPSDSAARTPRERCAQLCSASPIGRRARLSRGMLRTWRGAHPDTPC